MSPFEQEQGHPSAWKGEAQHGRTVLSPYRFWGTKRGQLASLCEHSVNT